LEIRITVIIKGQEKKLQVEHKGVKAMKNKPWMTMLALVCLAVGLLSGGCTTPQPSQRSELSPLTGGEGFPNFPGEMKNNWSHPMVTP
jgi:hypothetical protein